MTNQSKPKRRGVFHLTPAVNVSRIQRDGIRANGDGEIFAFTDPIVANTIAREQVGAKRYAVFAIHPAGLRGKLYADRVGELSARFQVVIRQDRIEPEHVHHVGTYATQPFPDAWDHAKYRAMGYTREQVDGLAGQARTDQAERRLRE